MLHNGLCGKRNLASRYKTAVKLCIESLQVNDSVFNVRRRHVIHLAV